ncbi:hypothetical protein [Streptomyces sp. NPDC058755]|uniref:hypothetical protein n=1 Tax=Streptomyces sp. NPDC058755 TaxID=3346624 RepID=UPI00368A0B7A
MRRKVMLGEGEVQQVAAACARALRGVDATTGEQLDEAALVARAGWLADLVEALAAGVVGEHWNGADLARLASGTDALGGSLPSQGWMALRRLGWAVTVPAGVYVPDRVVRIAQEQAGRVLRSAWWRAEITAALLATWPADPARRTEAEWEALREALPEGGAVATSVLLARTRQLTVRMPLRPDPSSRADWHPVRVRFRLPPHVPATAVLCAPTLRIRQGRLLLDVPYAHAVHKPERTGHSRAVAFDWGLNTLLTGGTLHLTDEAQPRVVTDARPLSFRAAGVLAKSDRLRLIGEHIGARGLTHQYKTCLDRSSQTFVIRTVVEALDQASQVQHQTWDRTKSRPTAKRPAPGKRRKVPAPPGTPPGGKRPAGRNPTHPMRRIQRCSRQQGPCAIGTPTRHQPDGARLGAGFHRHAHTTPIRGWPWPSHLPGRSRTPGITQETQAD